jgi:Methyltransferase FkbM domain
MLEQFPRPTFVKIDVEGAEVMVLRGASKLLRDVRPTRYVEVGRENSDEGSRILHSFDYRLYDSTKQLRSQTAARRSNNPVPLSCLFNIEGVTNRVALWRSRRWWLRLRASK